MENNFKLLASYDTSTTRVYLNFIGEVKDGVFTNLKPELPPVEYQRLVIPESDRWFDQMEEEVQILTGYSD